jgi:geranylgeranyl pyrophosphate synthase
MQSTSGIARTLNLNEPGAETSWHDPPSAADETDATLNRYAGLLQEEFARTWADDSDSLAAMARYALAAPGKLLRPILLLESALAVGGQIEHVLPAAVGTECGHVASLTHDDIIDGDDVRRGQPAVHRKFGTDDAIVAGDALIFQLFLCLARCRHAGVAGDRVAAALEVVATAGVRLCRGQILESEITARQQCSVDAYREMIAHKTAALFEGTCRSGAILAGAPEPLCEDLGRYGRELGIAFQVADDLLPYLSSDEAVGKPSLSDVRNRRLTLPVILAQEAADPADLAALSLAFGDAIPADEALEVVRGVLERTDAVTRCVRMAMSHADEARRALGQLPASASRDRLEAFARRAVIRQS